MKQCTRCLMPVDAKLPLGINRPGEGGVCLACLNSDKRDLVDWQSRWAELAQICSVYRHAASQYDCVIAVSGGKDSHALTWLMVHEMGMKALLVNVSDPFAHTNAGTHNLQNLTKTFGCDLLTYTMPFPLFKAAARQGFEQGGDPLRLVEHLIYMVPVYFAYKLEIPLLVYGEDSYFEYGASPTETSPFLHIKKCFTAAQATNWGHPLPPFYWRDDMPRAVKAIYASHYLPWDGRHNYRLAAQYGFRDLAGEWERVGYNENYDQIDSLGYMVHIWLKYPKFGFARQPDILSRWIRRGHITRKGALKLNEIDSELDQQALEDFCAVLGYETAEFWEIVDKFYNEDLFEKRNGVWYPKEGA